MSGQSAPTKQRAPTTGTAGSWSASRTRSTCLSTPSTSFVQDGEVLTGERVEPGADDLLALRTAVPGAGALRLVGDGEQQAADAREALAHPLLAGIAPPFELPPGRRAGGPAIRLVGDLPCLHPARVGASAPSPRCFS